MSTILSVRNKLRQSKFINFIWYDLGLDNAIVRSGSRSFKKQIDEAFSKYLLPEELKDAELKQKLSKDIINCYCRYKSSPAEYFRYGFRTKENTLRSTYVTDKYINMTLAKVVGRKCHDEEINDKFNFYKLTEPYFKRKVVKVGSSSDWSSFKEMALSVGKLIIKPNDAALGSGIFLADINSEEEAKELFGRILNSNIRGGYCIVEQRVIQSDSMAVWNPTSVNTVRLSTFLTKKGFFVLSAMMRNGRAGQVVDNAGHGGVAASMDTETGIIITDGIDKMLNHYTEHPNSKVKYKGFQIPRWEELLKTAEDAHRMIPQHIYIGWDFALTDDGWVVIEGNWGELIAQQSSMGVGFKPKFDEYLSAGVLMK